MDNIQLVNFNGETYEEHLILFMDILGYSRTMLCGKETEKNALIDFQQALRDSDKSGHFHMSPKGAEINVKLKPLTSLLSDTLVFSFPIAQIPEHHSTVAEESIFRYFFRKIWEVSSLALERNHLVRGAIAVGKISNHNGCCYGEGLAKAASLEKCGNQPFIFCDASVTERIRLSNRGFTTYLVPNVKKKEDDKDLWYIDYLRYIANEEINPDQTMLFLEKRRNYSQKLHAGISRYGNDLPVQEKWSSALVYYERILAYL